MFDVHVQTDAEPRISIPSGLSMTRSGRLRRVAGIQEGFAYTHVDELILPCVFKRLFLLLVGAKICLFSERLPSPFILCLALNKQAVLSFSRHTAAEQLPALNSSSFLTCFFRLPKK